MIRKGSDPRKIKRIARLITEDPDLNLNKNPAMSVGSVTLRVSGKVMITKDGSFSGLDASSASETYSLSGKLDPDVLEELMDDGWSSLGGSQARVAGSAVLAVSGEINIDASGRFTGPDAGVRSRGEYTFTGQLDSNTLWLLADEGLIKPIK